MAHVISMSHLMTPSTTSKHIQAEIDVLQRGIESLTRLRDQYLKEEKAGTRKP